MRPVIWNLSASRLLDDRHREAPRYNSLGDDSVPCRWWHPDIGWYCARCGSGRMDLHDGWWGTDDDETDDAGAPFVLPRGGHHGIPWNLEERIILGLYVEPEWWHQAAGHTPRTVAL